MSDQVKHNFPLASESEASSGWTLSYPYLQKIKDECRQNGDDVSLEQVEAVLLSSARQTPA